MKCFAVLLYGYFLLQRKRLLQNRIPFYGAPPNARPFRIQSLSAVELIQQQKAAAAAAATPLKTFAEDKELVIRSGRYGAYIAYKGKNYRLPTSRKVEELSFEECMNIVNTTKKKR